MTGDPAPARKELLKHVSEIRMMPQQAGDGKGHYVAKGEWRLLGNQQDALKALEPAYREIRVVAGAGFEPATFGLLVLKVMNLNELLGCSGYCGIT